MCKKITEQEQLLINELFVYKLKNLFQRETALFYQVNDLLGLPVYINDRKTLNYSYFNETTLSLGDEMEALSVSKKHSDTKQYANPILFEYSKKRALYFDKINDATLVCKIPQEVNFNAQMTFFISDKIFLNDKKALNLITFPKAYGTIGKIIEEIIPNYTKDMLSWQRFQSLTKQEKAILKMLVIGISFKEIAERLYISKHTINTHRKHIHKKLNVKNSNELMLVAFTLDFFDFSL